MKKLHLLVLGLAAAGVTAHLSAQAPVPAEKSAKHEKSVQTASMYLITFIEPGVLYNDGRGGSFAATAPAQTGSRKLNAQLPAVLAYRAHLATKQDRYLSQMSTLLGRKIEAKNRYDITHNGMAVELTPDEAARVQGIAGVSKVEAEVIYKLNTDAGPAFIGAPAAWNGSSTYSAIGTRGQGVVVGIFDSGANSDHPSFANDPACGFSAGTPKLIAAKDCNTTNCAAGDGEDVSIFVSSPTLTGSSGHGVHTASTAIGNSVAAGTMVNGVPARFNISGVAPCARVISYKVCGTTAPSGTAGCGGAAIQAAIQTSIIDQVDVVNFSISGGNNPWFDNDRGFLDMVNADIVVAASSGNTSTSITDPVGAVAHKGPWVMTVANSTHDRIITNPVSVAGSLQNVRSQTSNGTAPNNVFASTVNSQVASAALLGNEFGCTDTGGFAPGSMTGRIALIQRGPPAPGTACGFSVKINNAAAAGATGVVIYDRTAGPPLSMDVIATPTTIPAIAIRQAAGYTIRDYLAINPTALMTITFPAERIVDPSNGDTLNSSSLRGPNATFDVTKPDITGPGTNIYAASSDNFGQFIFLTGTSMSSPHLAGAAALIRSAQPTWTPPEVKSAIMLTASVAGLKDTEAAPWDTDDVGNGRIDLTRAARSGLVMHETFANFLAANPSGGNVNPARQLNLPSMRHVTIAGSYVFTRTFRNAAGRALTWESVATPPPGMTVTVSPASFSFGYDTAQTQTVTITVTVNAAQTPIGFGAVEFRPTAMFSDGLEVPRQFPHPARLTIAAKGTP